jgi:hypothetical protein
MSLYCVLQDMHECGRAYNGILYGDRVQMYGSSSYPVRFACVHVRGMGGAYEVTMA